jgi:hypothetical protein
MLWLPRLRRHPTKAGSCKMGHHGLGTILATTLE